MAYIKQNWVDQEGQIKYTITDSGDGYKILTPNYEDVYPLGTPVDALHMNYIENGIEQCYTDFENMIKAIYPVGSIYIGMTETCPLASLFGTWELISGGLSLQQANVTYPVGTEIPAGLPDITGAISGDISNASGAFSLSSSSVASADGVDNNSHRAAFNASSSNSIYGQSDTVQPPALAVNIWQRTA